jgi:hypothetical protein
MGQETHKCSTTETWINYQQKNPDATVRRANLEKFTKKWISEGKKLKIDGEIITIPVVVHVLYHFDEDNISDEQIFSQIDVLNEDFRLLNSDALDSNHPFWDYTADAEIEFCLASVDPFGNETDGITRTYTDTIEFTNDDDIKFSDSGGVDNWDPHSYLNLWVFPLSGTTLGFATFPSDLKIDPELDGVVITTNAFGYLGELNESNDMGRTATHEVGHWLNLRHIWGDEPCGDDFVDDTEPAEEANDGCPDFPHRDYNQCGTLENGEMFMNYMDYVDDACMNMFTFGQVDRMWATLLGPRSELQSSIGCNGKANSTQANLNTFKIFPNPTNGSFTISFLDQTVSLEISDVLGKKIFSISPMGQAVMIIDLNGKLQPGTYLVRDSNSIKNGIQKLIIE